MAQMTPESLEQLQEIVGHAPDRVANLRPRLDFAHLQHNIKREVPDGIDTTEEGK